MVYVGMAMFVWSGDLWSFRSERSMILSTLWCLYKVYKIRTWTDRIYKDELLI